MAAITVRRLISQLKKMPQNALVGYRNHDQSIDELDGLVAGVAEGDRELINAHSEILEVTGKKTIVVLYT